VLLLVVVDEHTGKVVLVVDVEDVDEVDELVVEDVDEDVVELVADTQSVVDVVDVVSASRSTDAPAAEEPMQSTSRANAAHDAAAR